MALVVRSGGVPVALRSRIARSVTALDSVEMFLTGEQYLSGRIAHREDAVIARIRNNSVFISFGQESLLFSRAMARKMTFVRDLYEVSSSNGVMEQHFHVGIACDRRQAERVFLRGRKRREKCAKGSRVKGRERLFSGHAVTSV